MTPERWRQITDIFNGALAISDSGAREAYLIAACDRDASLRAEIDSLIAAYQNSTDPLQVPVLEESRTRSRLAAGTLLGPYRVEGLLGAGGMGEVYRAHDTRLGRTVALKILPTHLRTQPQLLARFEREARAVALLNHPHICTLYDIGQQENIGYLVMELVEGETLAERLRRGPLPVNDAIALTREVAEALAAAHAKGIIHRDVKPSNIIVTRGGHVKIVDFGIARESSVVESSAAPSRDQTEPGMRIGTLHYMSAEQALGQPLDARADVFALGAVLFECLTGELPFEGQGKDSYLPNLLAGRVKRARSIRPEVPEALESLLGRCLERDPSKRLDSAAQLVTELDGILHDWVIPVSKRWLLPTVAAGTLVSTLVVLIVVFTPEAKPPAVDQIEVPQLRQFTTTTGEESDSHFSPDEMWMSFIATEDGQRRLFAQQIDGGVRRPVTIPPGIIQSHVWSPDGKAYACLMYQDPEWSVQIVDAIFGGDVPKQTVRAPHILRSGRLLKWIDRTVYLQVDGPKATPYLQRLDLERGTFNDVSGPWTKMQVRGFDVSTSGDVLWTVAEGRRDDLWSAHIDGSNARQLTSTADESTKRLPLWNRDGSTVVYQSAKGGQVDVWELNLRTGRSERRSSDPGIERPDSTSKSGSISYQLSFQKTALWKWNVRTRQGNQISDEGLSDFAPSTSRDGNLRVAFQRSTPSPIEGFLMVDSEIFVADVQTDVTRLPPARKVGTGFAPRLSPDGRWIAHLQRAQPAPTARLVLTNLGTSGAEVISSSIAAPSGSTFPVDWAEQNLAWASTEELYFVERLQHADGKSISRLTRYRIGSGAMPLEATETPDRVSDVYPASDGKTIAYVTSQATTDPEREDYKLHLFDVTTGTDRVIDLGTSELLRFRGWTANDVGLVIARSLDSGSDLTWSVELSTVALDGSIRPSDTIGQVVTVSRFVPSTRDLYFTRSLNGVANLFAYSFTSRKERRITENTVLDVTFGGVTPLDSQHVIGIRHDQTRDIHLLDARPHAQSGAGIK